LVNIQASGGDLQDLTFSPDGLRLATAGDAGTITLWDAHSGQEVFKLRGHNGPVLRLTFSPDGRFLTSSGTDGTVKLWDAGRAVK
jgi:WD40 repeat protein